MDEHLQKQLEGVGSWLGSFAVGAFGLAFAFIGLLFLLFFIVVWCKIWSKTGNSGFLGLLMFIPLVNFIMIMVLAFSDWPVHRELRLLKGGSTGSPRTGG